MKNDGKYFYLDNPDGKISRNCPKICPDEVFPLEYRGVSMFSFKGDDGIWRIIECRTGTRMASCEDQEKAHIKAREYINTFFLEILGIIQYYVEMIEAGFEYNPETFSWEPLDPVEELGPVEEPAGTDGT